MLARAIHVQLRTYTHTRTQAQSLTYTYTPKRAHTHSHTHAPAPMHARTRTHARTHAHTRTQWNTWGSRKSDWFFLVFSISCNFNVNRASCLIDYLIISHCIVPYFSKSIFLYLCINISSLQYVLTSSRNLEDIFVMKSLNQMHHLTKHCFERWYICYYKHHFSF